MGITDWRGGWGCGGVRLMNYATIFDRHEKVALHVSGGKDSLALLTFMRPWWDKLCVFWLNPGDPFPETLALMARIKTEVPFFAEVRGRQPEIVERDGWPSDVIPQSHTSDGNFIFGETPFKVQSRLSCCYRAMMLPMHERMKELGVTCILRGKRSSEKDKSPSRSGETHDGFELIYPLWNWSENDVLSYLLDNGIDIPESYDYAGHSLDCMSCTAWWGEGLSYFLKAKYPERYVEYVRRITLIKSAISDEMNNCEV
jgi:3'-phosphoadenosine 5'-phosphosulfate sulfotransferase (PAPS reductase)/FAD synthetase